MHTRPALFESLETRRLMSATCGDVLAAEVTSEPVALLLPAVQKVREAAARMSAPAGDMLAAETVSVTDGTSNTFMIGEKPTAEVVDGTSNTIFFAEKYV